MDASGPVRPVVHDVHMPIKPLDIMLTVSIDHWLYDALPRCLGMVKRCMPDARVHILLTVSDSVLGAEIAHVKHALKDKVTQVKVIRHRQGEIAPMLYYEKLRAVLLNTFGLSEGLYMDTDIDAVESVAELVDTHTDKCMLWTRDFVRMDDCLYALRKNGYNVDTLMQCGLIYLREYAYLQHLDRLQSKFPYVVNHTHIPGTVYWNMLMRDLGDQAQELPAEYHTTFWDVRSCISSARLVHYSGRWKHVQPYVRYVRTRPARIELYTVQERFEQFEILPYERTTS